MTLTDQIIGSLKQEPERWFENNLQIINHNKKVHIWSANGMCNVKIDFSPKGCIRLNLWSRWRIWRAIKAWRELPI
jgi:hypothetical protein